VRTKVVAVCISAAFAAVAKADPMTLEQLTKATTAAAEVESAISPVRAQKLSEVALEIGSKAGSAARAEKIVQELEGRAAKLDQLYRFGSLITKNGVLPPVITEARDAIQATDDQVRVADRIYKIVVRARFARTTPPTWRQYLFVGLLPNQKIPTPPPSTQPKTPEEIAYWKEQLKVGWGAGEKLADEILERNMARLDRDYLGILRYSELLNKGMVSEPTVSVAATVVSGNKEEMAVGDTLYRVTDAGGLVTDANKWQPVVIMNEPLPIPAKQEAGK